MGIVSVGNMFVMYLIIMGILGLITPIINTPAIVILQETVEAEMYGRIFSIVNMIASAIMPLSMVVFGPLSDIIDIEVILIVSSVLFMLIPLAFIKDKTIQTIPIVVNQEEEGLDK